MAINSNRRFNKWGRKFYVQNYPSNELKYCLSLIDENDLYHFVYDKITLEMPKFKTIKDAQRWVWFHSGEGDFITTLREEILCLESTEKR